MCIKLADSELGSVKALMTLSLNAIVADVFKMEPEDITPELRLVDDLKMRPDQQTELDELIAEYFDGQRLEFTPAMTLADVFDAVVNRQFATVAEYVD